MHLGARTVWVPTLLHKHLFSTMFSVPKPTTDSLHYVHLLGTISTLSPGILSHPRALTRVQPRYPVGLFQRQDGKLVQARVDRMPWDEINTSGPARPLPRF